MKENKAPNLPAAKPPWAVRKALKKALKANPALVGITYNAVRDLTTGEIDVSQIESDRLIATCAKHKEEGLYYSAWACSNPDPAERYFLLVNLMNQFHLHPLDVITNLSSYWEECRPKGEPDNGDTGAKEL